MRILPETIGIDFTDEAITGSAGSLFLSRMAGSLGLPEALEKALRLKQRRRGASDREMLLSAIYSLATGDGALRDVDRLGADEVRTGLLGLETVPDSRRVSDYLARFDERAVGRLRGVAQRVGRRIVGEVIAHQRATKGYVPVFVDGSGIEVSGDCFEGAAEGYNGEEQYWLHNVFVGGLWVGQELHSGGCDVAEGWRKLLEESAPLLFDAGDVWARMDNAYYRGEVVSFCRQMGWDYSISVTHDTYKAPLKRRAWAVPDWEWEAITDDGTEEATVIRHRPDGWEAEASYVVVRSWWDGTQRRLTPRHTFLLVSRTDLPLAELVTRHRGKQGQENAQKGPLIDLGLHHPPCRRFAANRAFYTLGQIAQNLLVAVQYLLLPRSARVHGIRTILRDLVRLPGRLVRHSRRWTLRFAKTVLRLDWIAHAADRLDAMARSPG